MSLRILFADDSVTAQNMGKKILTEAGYEVVAVSNGAAAVKKIAEQKPDIIILDVYMPGYSGLEVCEKVRSSIATIKTPVLLTVGKMEPYKPEEANRVRADGVIIKPFEASDLLAIIKKFEERIGETLAAAPPPPPAAIRQSLEEIKVPAPETNHEPPPRVMQPMVEVPDHMATSSAFSDLLGTDATRMESFHVPAVAEVAPERAEAPAIAAPETDFDMPASWRQEPEPQPTIVETPVASAPAGVAAAIPARPIQIPVYQEPEPTQFEVVPTAAPPLGDIEIPREAGLQESAEETTRNTVADHRDPDLVPTAHNIIPPQAAEASRLVAEMPMTARQEIPIVADEAELAELQVIGGEMERSANDPQQHVASLSEVDFEARVAAAMAAYGQAAENRDVVARETAVEEPPLASSGSAQEYRQPSPANMEPEEVQAAHAEAPISSPPEVGESAPVIEAPAPQIEAVPTPVASNPTVEIPAAAHAAAAGASHDSVMASVEAELSSTMQATAEEIHATAQTTGTAEHEHETIAQAVHRVMERMKENLVEEIVRELKTKK